jgi:hypothetical protein
MLAPSAPHDPHLSLKMARFGFGARLLLGNQVAIMAVAMSAVVAAVVKGTTVKLLYLICRAHCARVQLASLGKPACSEMSSCQLLTAPTST